MIKDTIQKEDGRLLNFYWFGKKKRLVVEQQSSKTEESGCAKKGDVSER